MKKFKQEALPRLWFAALSRTFIQAYMVSFILGLVVVFIFSYANQLRPGATLLAFYLSFFAASMLLSMAVLYPLNYIFLAKGKTKGQINA